LIDRQFYENINNGLVKKAYIGKDEGGAENIIGLRTEIRE
jgi:hypothetical protein